MILIGENINATNKEVAGAIAQRDEKFFIDLATAQTEAGADFIDVNAGSGHGPKQEGIAAMEWLVETVQKATDMPLTIDSDDPAIISAALNKYRGEKVIINSVTAEPARLESIGPLAAERQAWLIALAMDAEGIPASVGKRLDACDSIMTYLTGLGMAAEQILFDPLVLPIAVDTTQGLVTLQTIAQIKSRYPQAKTTLGLSNASYGLPMRGVINRALLLIAMYLGLDSVILDPLDTKLMAHIKAAQVVLGRDTFCKNYLKDYRKGRLME